MAPITGSNTFIGDRKSPNNPPKPLPSKPLPPQSVSSSGQAAVAKQSLPRAQKLFKPSADDGCEKFSKGLHEAIRGLGAVLGETNNTFAESLSKEILRIRKEKACGFLHDKRHWVFLISLLPRPGFVIATAKGKLCAEVLALAEQKEVIEVTDKFDKMTEQELLVNFPRGAKSTVSSFSS